MELRNILLATDFSASSENAQAAAFTIAETFGAKLHVFHALEVPLPIFEPFAVAVPEVFIGEVRKIAEEKLGSIVDAAASRGISASSELGAAPAPAEIAEEARRLNADLVLVGTEGHTGIQHIVLGSVAEGTVKRAPCSVLAVRDPLDPPPATIVVGTDFSPDAKAALQEACDLADRLGSDLHLVHAAAAWPPLVGAYEIAVPTAYEDSFIREGERQMQELASTCQIKGELTTKVISGAAPVVLCDVAEKLQSGLIIVGSHGRTGLKHLALGSVAERTVRNAPCSVWTMRSRPDAE